MFSWINEEYESILQDLDTLKNLLLNHVISSKVRASDITDGMKATNLAGNELEMNINENGVTVAGAPVGR